MVQHIGFEMKISQLPSHFWLVRCIQSFPSCRHNLLVLILGFWLPLESVISMRQHEDNSCGNATQQFGTSLRIQRALYSLCERSNRNRTVRPGKIYTVNDKTILIIMGGRKKKKKKKKIKKKKPQCPSDRSENGFQEASMNVRMTTLLWRESDGKSKVRNYPRTKGWLPRLGW